MRNVHAAVDLDDSRNLPRSIYIQSCGEIRLPSSCEIVGYIARNRHLEMVVASAIERLHFSRRGQNLVTFSQHA
jgi:hypothetical protein